MLYDSRMGNDAGTIPTTLQEARQVIAERDAVIDRLRRDVDLLKSRLYSQLRYLHGPKSERFANGQLPLFGSPVEIASPVLPKPKTSHKQNRRNGRQALPECLPRVEETLTVSDEEAKCFCCDPPKQRQLIGHEVTEILEYTPAKLFVRVIKREKRACSSGNDTVVTPDLPARILPKSRAGVSLLTYLVIAKYLDHMPLHRIRKRFRRDGVNLPDTTLCDWITAISDALAPIVLAMKHWMLRRRYLQADETPAKARDPEVKGKLKQIYFFVYSIPWAEVIFDYRTNRRGENAISFLDGFAGQTIQVDDYRGYDQVFLEWPDLVRAGCWVHARRYFKKALDRGDRPSECADILEDLKPLFHLETLMRVKGRDFAARLQVRQRIHRPVMERLRDRCAEVVQDPCVEPQSDFGKAVRYVHRNRENLSVFLEDGEIEMDNNGIENAIRPLALGRKNWLHIGHIEAGDRAAILYSILATCERLGINAREYLLDILDRLPTQAPECMHELTPRAWRDRQRIKAERHSAAPP